MMTKEEFHKEFAKYDPLCRDLQKDLMELINKYGETLPGHMYLAVFAAHCGFVILSSPHSKHHHHDFLRQLEITIQDRDVKAAVDEVMAKGATKDVMDRIFKKESK
jgi:hypothetical protein